MIMQFTINQSINIQIQSLYNSLFIYDTAITTYHLKNGSSSNSLKRDPPNIVRCLYFPNN